MIELINVSKRFNRVMVVEDLSVQFKSGLITALIGTNGAGKTTILNILTGLVAPDSGAVSLGFETAGEPSTPQDYRRSGIIRTFQEPRVFPELTPIENLRFYRPESLFETLARAFRVRNDSSWRGKNEVSEVLANFGLQPDEDKPCSDLSHGQKRLVELALAFSSTGNAYLLDEPSAGLAPEPKSVVHERLLGLRSRDAVVIVVDHDVEFVQRVADEIIFLDAGHVVAAGKAAEVLENREVKGHLWGAWT